jgi:hypothetical protein
MSQKLVFPEDPTQTFTAAPAPGPLTYAENFSNNAIRVTRGPLSVLLYKLTNTPTPTSPEDAESIHLGAMPDIDWELVRASTGGRKDDSKMSVVARPDGTLNFTHEDNDVILSFPYAGNPVQEDKKIEVQCDTVSAFAVLQRIISEDVRCTGADLVPGKSITLYYGPEICLLIPDISVERNRMPEGLAGLERHLREFQEMLGDDESVQCTQQ